MRLNEILIEQQLDERPMGILGKAVSKAKSFVPGRTGRKAQGELEVGKIANDLSDKFDKYLGMVGGPEGATPEIVIGFLKKNGYPTKGAEAAMKAPTTGQKIGQAAATAAKGIGAGAKAVGGAIAKGAQATGNLAKDMAAGAKTGAQAATAAPATQAQPAAEPAQDTAAATTEPTAQPAKTQPTGRTQGGGKIAGQTSQTPVAIKKRNARAKPGQQLQLASVENQDQSVLEGFTGGQLDNIFMAAAKDFIAQNQGGLAQQGTGKVDEPAQGGAGGFMSGFKQAFNKSTDNTPDGKNINIPADIEKQINSLNPAQKKELLGML
jgi:hypothetical protein